MENVVELVLASMLVPLSEIWQRVPDQGQQLVPSQLRAQAQWDCLPVISEFPKSWWKGAQVARGSPGSGSIIHAFLFVFDAILNTCSWICRWHPGSLVQHGEHTVFCKAQAVVGQTVGAEV